MSAELDENINVILTLLRDECTKDEFASAVATLLKIHRNIKEHPSEEKYCHLRRENKAFAHKVWKFDGAKQLLFAIGWTELDDSIVLTDVSHVNSAVAQLETQSLPRPEVPEAHTSTCWTKEELEQKEAIIRENKKRQMERRQKDQDERKHLTEQIKHDREDSNARESKDSKARHLQGSGGMLGYKDIGMNLNKGSG